MQQHSYSSMAVIKGVMAIAPMHNATAFDGAVATKFDAYIGNAVHVLHDSCDAVYSV